jgi:hypothetical protein
LDTLVNKKSCDLSSLVDKLEEALDFMKQLMAEEPYNPVLDLPVALVAEVAEELLECIGEEPE